MPTRCSVVAVVLSLVFAAGCAGSPPAAGSTGAFGVVTVNGRQKMYLPLLDPNAAGHGQVAVVDVGEAGKGVAGANALITDIDLGTADYATTTGGDATVIVAASTDNPTIWLIDPTEDKVTKTLSLGASAGQSGFSGGGGYVTGIAMDSAHDQAILSVWNGFALLDTKTGTITKTIHAAPAENFGFDSIHQRIIAPFYECTSSLDPNGNNPGLCDQYKEADGTVITDGLNVIDLTNDTVYTYVDPKAANPPEPVGGEPDSAAADPTSQVVVVPSESDDYQNVIDLSRAHFDPSSKTFTAPDEHLGAVELTGVAVEPSRHDAFLEDEGSDGVGFFRVDDANSGTGKLLDAMMPSLPDGSYWTNIGDPHGIAVSTALHGGRSVGFLVDDGRAWVARIDLETLAGLKADATGQIADISPAVTFLAVQK